MAAIRARLLVLCVSLIWAAPSVAGDPPVIDPFGPRPQSREDAIPGYLELSDGTVHPGRVYLTREAKLKIYDDAQKRFREVPLEVVQRIDCTVAREWTEKEWRFKENANDEKIYTGRTYPVREYTHTITLQDGRTIRGPLSAIVYVEPAAGGEAERHLLHKRDKGEPGTELKAFLYVRGIRLGDKALEEGKKKATKR